MRTWTGSLFDRIKQLLHPVCEKINVIRVIIQAWYLHKILTSSILKCFFADDRDFFQGFEAIGDKTGANDQQSLHSRLWQPSQFMISKRLEPRLAGQA